MVGMTRSVQDQRWYRLSILLLVLAAWVALATWGASPFADLLDHRKLDANPLSPIAELAVFVLGWMLMTVAMMLPSSLPLLNLFGRMVQGRPDGGRLLALLIAGYLGSWGYVGGLAYLGDSLLHAAVDAIPALAGAAGGIGAGILLLAGGYQFTPLKQMCLDQCRTPYSFLAQHWHGRRSARDTVVLGIRHGIFCIGCCWTLMLLMFAVGGINPGWMLTLGAFMAAERAMPWGRRLTRPLGAALILWAALLLFGGAPFPG